MATVALIEPYYGGSHKYWADRLKSYSRHDIDVYHLPPRHWKWRMQGSAYTLSKQVNSSSKQYDLYLCSSMIDLAFFKSLIDTPKAPMILYMHENQLHYPISVYDKQADLDLSYGYLNYKSCLAADHVMFNSYYHKDKFLESCSHLLSKMPDFKNIESIDQISRKSVVTPIGLDVSMMDNHLNYPKKLNKTAKILWNHRWDYDKNPEMFYALLKALDAEKLDFKLVLTTSTRGSSETLNKIIKEFEDQIEYIGYLESRNAYFETLSKCHICPVPQGHDYFGLSVLEAVHLGVYPILPKDSVYEEHFNTQTCQDVFYSDMDGFIQSCIQAISLHKQLSFAGQEHTKQYDWLKVIHQYDSFIDSLHV